MPMARRQTDDGNRYKVEIFNAFNFHGIPSTKSPLITGAGAQERLITAQ